MFLAFFQHLASFKCFVGESGSSLYAPLQGDLCPPASPSHFFGKVTSDIAGKLVSTCITVALLWRCQLQTIRNQKSFQMLLKTTQAMLKAMLGYPSVGNEIYTDPACRVERLLMASLLHSH